MKIASIIGGRPQIFKVDPDLTKLIIDTGQHYDHEMAGQHFKEMKIKPKYFLNCTSEEIGKMIDEARKVLRKEKPDVVIVYGDTYSTLAGAIAASLENIKVAHVEAGLRSHDRSMPEETNRIVADVLSTYRFCPTHVAMRNLIEEGLGEGSYLVGDTLFWTMKYFTPIKDSKDKDKYVFASIHRRENLNPDILREILKGLGEIKMPIYFPIHPHTHRIIKKNKLKIPKNVEVVKPQSRKKTLERIHNSKMVITDSGGITREAYWMLKHSLIIRWTTEWEEIVSNGWATLVPANAKKIAEAGNAEYPHAVPPQLPRHDPYAGVRKILHG
jgi:UDP-N-acetylglucosamine 2-epimerase